MDVCVFAYVTASPRATGVHGETIVGLTVHLV